MNKKGEAGIGTLILFIAMILVAAVAAGVLIQTSSSLQSKALYTGSRAKSQVSSEAAVTQMWGEDASVGTVRHINRTFLKLKLAAGSDPIKMTDALLQVDTPNYKSDLSYNASLGCDNVAALYNARTSQYGSNISIGSDKTYLARGDVFKLCFHTQEDVNEGQLFRVSFIPKVGHTTTIDTKLPDVMLNQRVQLYP